jgi:hypothetical protein
MHIVSAAHVHDERVRGGTAFRGVQTSHRVAIEGVDAESVYGFRRKCDEAAVTKALRGAGDHSRIRRGRIDAQHSGHKQ